MSRNYILYWIFAVCLFASCRSVKPVVVKKDIPSIAENKLLKNIKSNELEYETLFAKKIEVSLTQKKRSDNFKASLKIKRDSFIQISLTAPLGIEVARVLLTRDSIKFVDTYHKKYFLADYQYFADRYDSYLSFDCIQKILTNTFFNFVDCSGIGKSRKYKLDKTNQGYELSTVEEKALSRKIKKFYKKKRKNKDFILILQKILIDPQLFRPLVISVEDVDEETSIAVNYKNLKSFSGKKFPEEIIFELSDGKDKITLELKFLKLEFDVAVEPNFRISSKYKKID